VLLSRRWKKLRLQRRKKLQFRRRKKQSKC
jgi:hypothetical protein